MDQRKEQLLAFIIEYYIATASPVGSQFISAEGALEVSAATIRNEMRELEVEGYLAQPHTSAGRIPTARGYRYYVDHLLKPQKISKKIEDELRSIIHEETEQKNQIKILAKALSEYVGNAVIVAFSKDSLYYTGIGNLFSQPEFQNYNYTVNISSLFDRCEEVVDDVYHLIGNKVTVLIGDENPFGSVCSLVGVPFGDGGLVSVLGPTRMEYAKTMSMLKHIKETV